MLQWKKERYDLAGPRVAAKLKERHFDAYYFSTAEEAVSKVLELIPETDTVGWGGTVTVDQLGIKDLLRKRGQALIDRDTASTPEERVEIMRKALLSDIFLMSSNAVTEDGQLLNIDGNGNRVAALCYGPKSVIVIAGMNKVVPDIKSAESYVRHTCAPSVTRRFPATKTPCNLTGLCCDCISPESSCAYMVTTRVCRPAGKIKVILIGEELGL